MILQEMFWKIIYICLERYSKDLTRKLAGGILTSEERIREVMNLVEQNLDEETMQKKLKEIRKRDNIPYEDEYDYEDWDDEYDDEYEEY